MKRNRKNSVKKERIIMIASSVFVLAALTMTGVYMKDRSSKAKDDGYSIDFDALENNANDKYEEIARQEQPVEPVQPAVPDSPVQEKPVTEDDLDYLPMEEAGSNLVEIPGLTDKESLEQADEAGQMGGGAPDADGEAEEEADQPANTEKVTVTKTLHFSESLVRPAAGEILIPYSMDKSVYFATLDQYKYNPAVLFSAAEGDGVSVCAEGKVLSVFSNEEIGSAVTIDLGDGYQATYGQLRDIAVKEGSYVNPGEVIGFVAAPTKYYSVEGTNVYFQLTKDGNPVNPEAMFQ